MSDEIYRTVVKSLNSMEGFFSKDCVASKYSFSDDHARPTPAESFGRFGNRTEFWNAGGEPAGI
jgi:hypothetical protein